MTFALLVARVLLAAVFVLAGLAKLADRASSRRALVNFGVPELPATPLAILLPLAELAAGVALLPRASAWWGAIGALALLLLFVLGIGVNLARGRRPNCHCFGQLYSAPIGTSTLVRNAALAAVAGFIVWQGREDAGRSAVGWLGDLSAARQVEFAGVLVLLGLLAGIMWFLGQIMGQNGRLLVRLEELEGRVAAIAAGGNVPAPTPAEPPPPARGLPVGTPAPTFALSGLYGESLTLDFLRAAGRPVQLVFTDPGCGPCNSLLPDIVRWQRELAGQATIALLSRGTTEANRPKSAEHGLMHVLLQQDSRVEQAYRVEGTPSAVLVRPDGTIGSPLAEGGEQIRALVAHIAGAPAPSPAAAPAPTVAVNGAATNGAVPAPARNGVAANGAEPAPVQAAAAQADPPAPAVRLPNLTGRTVDLADFRGSPTLVLFWNPGCGFCQQMLPDLKAWEANPPPGAPKLLVVSTGTVEANQAQGLRSPVVLDQTWATGNAFGVTGTPSAELVDAAGRIAGAPAVGSTTVVALLRGEQPRAPVAAPAAHANGAAAAAVAPVTLKVGQRAPAIKLPDLNGRTVDLADFRGARTVVLFWDPECDYCQQILPDLKAWEANRPKGAPKLLVVSTGTVEENRAMGLRSPVLLDEGFGVGDAFGATSTPSVVLIDAQGRIASDLVAGDRSVLELVGAKQGQARSA